MIEVEKKFTPTEEQLAKLLEGAEFVGEKTVHDVYYDYPDFRMFKKDIRLRNRNGNFELKIGDDEIAGIAEEIEDEGEIQKYFATELPLKAFIKENLVELINYKQNRKKYKKGDFTIDIDDLDFGYSCVEIELLVNTESEIETARTRIFDLAKENNFEIMDIPSKRKEYLRKKNPEAYKEIYG